MKEYTLTNTQHSPLARWYNRLLKRTIDFLVALALLLTVFPPVYCVVAIFIKTTRHGAVMEHEILRTLDPRTRYHRQRRLLRFRLPQTTFVRITRIDRWPRLINILFGQTSFASPRRTPADVYTFLSRWSPVTDLANLI